MYEAITYEQLLNRMLSRVPDDVDKREGSLIYNAVAPIAAEVKQMYIELDSILYETYADTATREFLVRRAQERGIVPKRATKAVLKGVFNKEIALGSRFTSGIYTFETIEKIGAGEYKMEAIMPGAATNTALGTIIPVQYIEGLTSAKLTEILIPGSDEEETEIFRARYFDSFDSQAFGGNIADYKVRTNNLPGVGGCKVKRTPEGAGTVGVTIIDSNYEEPSTILIQDVQTALDPIGNQGEGVGLAPIGHQVRVMGVRNIRIDITASITYAPGWDSASALPYILKEVDEYLLALRKTWADNDRIILRLSQIEATILNIDAVIDIKGTKINGQEDNVTLESNEIPIRGGMNV